MESIFEKVAKENNTTTEEVENEIMKAIDFAINSGNQKILQTPRKGEKPTPAELVTFLSDIIAHDKMN